MIKLKSISFSYGDKKIIDGLSLDIKKGERICLFGQSGLGKTTILRLILGLEAPQEGEIIRAEGIKLSAAFQEDRLLPFLSVLDNITLIGADKQTALSHLAALGLEGNESKRPNELSGGMRRRAAVARALSAEYDCLILDEPFAGLDSENISSAAEHINRSLDGRPLVLVTHSEKEAALLDAKIINLGD